MNQGSYAILCVIVMLAAVLGINHPWVGEMSLAHVSTDCHKSSIQGKGLISSLLDPDSLEILGILVLAHFHTVTVLYLVINCLFIH